MSASILSLLTELADRCPGLTIRARKLAPHWPKRWQASSNATSPTEPAKTEAIIGWGDNPGAAAMDLLDKLDAREAEAQRASSRVRVAT